MHWPFSRSVNHCISVPANARLPALIFHVACSCRAASRPRRRRTDPRSANSTRVGRRARVTWPPVCRSRDTQMRARIASPKRRSSLVLGEVLLPGIGGVDTLTARALTSLWFNEAVKSICGAPRPLRYRTHSAPRPGDVADLGVNYTSGRRHCRRLQMCGRRGLLRYQRTTTANS